MDFSEKERRYKLVRGSMRQAGFDALIVLCDAQIEKKGLLKYLTNYRSTLYNVVAIFPIEGEPRLLVPSAVQKVWAQRLSWISDVRQQLPSLNDILVNSIRDMGLDEARFGLASPQIMNANTYNYLTQNLPNISISDGSFVIDTHRLIKSISEQEFIRKAAAIATGSFDMVADFLKPGITELELISEIVRYLIREGAQDYFNLICSKPGDLMPFMPTGRNIEPGDAVILNTELSGPCGYWVQMVRTVFVGSPKGRTGKMYSDLLELTSRLPAMLIPGAKASDIADWVINKTNEAGYEVGVHFGHGQGLDVVESPVIGVNDHSELKAGMVVTVHPQFVTKDKTDTVWYADAYLVNDRGHAEILTKSDPQKLMLSF